MISVEPNPDGDPNDPAYWTSSSTAHGSPFVHDIIAAIDETLASKEMSKIQLYPNPTSDLLMVQTGTENSYISTLSIYDLKGRLYFQQEFDDYMEVSLNGLNMSSGIYIAEIVSDTGKETRKVIYAPR